MLCQVGVGAHFRTRPGDGNASGACRKCFGSFKDQVFRNFSAGRDRRKVKLFNRGSKFIKPAGELLTEFSIVQFPSQDHSNHSSE